MKKRIISVLLATVFALSVIGCGTKDTKEQDRLPAVWNYLHGERKV